jgi:iron complex transport system ATP-binding protein
LFPKALCFRSLKLCVRWSRPGRILTSAERKEDRERIQKAIERPETEHLVNRPVTELSGGERQRVMIARSLATDAATVLPDEPTANLDPAHASDVLDLCQSLSAAGSVVIVITQDLAMAMRYADRAVLMMSEMDPIIQTASGFF